MVMGDPFLVSFFPSLSLETRTMYQGTWYSSLNQEQVLPSISQLLESWTEPYSFGISESK